MLKRTCLFLAMLVATLVGAGCGEKLAIVERGDFGCVDIPCELNFGQVNLTRPGTNAKVRLTNTGDGDLQILGIALEESSPIVRFSDTMITAAFREADWRADSDSRGFSSTTTPIVIAPRGQFEVEVTLGSSTIGHGCPNPGEGGTVQCGFVVVTSDDTDAADSVLRVPILLSVGDSRMELEPTVLSFAPAQLIDAAAGTYAEQERTFQVRNIGTGSMQITSMAVSPENELTIEDASGSLSLPVVVVGGAAREFTVRWRPQSEDALEGTVRVTSNAAAGGVQVISLNSEGGDTPVIDVDPCDIALPVTPVGEAAEQLFDVSNTGTATLTWSLTIVNVRPTTSRTDFEIQTTAGDVTSGQQTPVAAGDTATLKLVHRPTSDGSVSGEISFRGNFGASFSCPFSAGEAAAIAAVVPAELYWGGAAEGVAETRSFVVSNTGRAPLEVTSIDESGDTHEEFSLSPLDAGGFTVQPGGTRRIDVTYTRTVGDVPAEDNTVLSVNHPGVGAGQTLVSLSASHGAALLPPTCVLDVDPPEPHDVGETLTLSAAGSSLNAGDWVANPFDWNLTRPDGSTARLSSRFGETVTLALDVAGTYTVGLNATALVEGESLSCGLTRTIVAR